MVTYNRGRFIFMFDPITEKLSAVYDTNYDAAYTASHPAFIQVFKIAIETLDMEALEELKKKFEDEPKYSQAISKLIYERNNQKAP